MKLGDFFQTNQICDLCDQHKLFDPIQNRFVALPLNIIQSLAIGRKTKKNFVLMKR